MRTLYAAPISALVICLSTTATAAASTESALVSGMSLEMTINDATVGYRGEACAKVSHSFTLGRALPGTTWEWVATITKDGEGFFPPLDYEDSGEDNGTAGGSWVICGISETGTWDGQVVVTLDSPLSDPVSTTLDVPFEIKPASTTTTISTVRVSSYQTKVKGQIATTPDANALAEDAIVVVKVKKPGQSWKERGEVTLNSDGSFTVYLDKEYSSGTKFKAVYRGNALTEKSTSDKYTL